MVVLNPNPTTDEISIAQCTAVSSIEIFLWRYAVIVKPVKCMLYTVHLLCLTVVHGIWGERSLVTAFHDCARNDKRKEKNWLGQSETPQVWFLLKH